MVSRQGVKGFFGLQAHAAGQQLRQQVLLASSSSSTPPASVAACAPALAISDFVDK